MRALGFWMVACLVGGSYWGSAPANIQAQLVQANPPAAAAVTFELKGVWAGVAYLDEDKLKAKFDLLQTPEEKEAFIRKGEAFLSAVAAFRFTADGQFESDIELLNISGEIERAAAQGRYRVVESQGPKFMVEFIEIVADGKSEKEQKLLQFYEDGQHLAILVPAPEEFKDCNPLMIFQRVPEQQLAAGEIIAQEQAKGQIK